MRCLLAGLIIVVGALGLPMLASTASADDAQV